MDCPKHEEMVKDIEKLKHLTKENKAGVQSNHKYCRQIEEKVNNIGYNRVADSRDQKNLFKLVESIDSKLDKLVQGLEDKVNNLSGEVNQIKSQLAVNDYKTDTSTQELAKVNSVIRNMNGWDVAKVMGLMIAFGGLIVSVIQALGG